jgi:hypothetical protein
VRDLWKLEELYKTAAASMNAALSRYDRALEFARTGRRNDAVAVLVEGRRTAPDSIWTRRLEQALQNEAAGSTAKARDQALSAGATEEKSAAFRAGAAQERVATASRDAKASIEAFWSAGDAYTKAAEEARLAPKPTTTPVVGTGDKSSSTPEGKSAPDKSRNTTPTGTGTTAAGGSGAGTPSTGSGPGPQAVSANDAAAVKRLINEYFALYGQFEVDALRHLYPGLSARDQQRISSLKQLSKSCAYELTDPKIVATGASSVQADLTVTETCAFKAAMKNARGQAAPFLFELTRNPQGSWTISKVFGL